MKNWLANIKRIDVMPRPGGTDLRYSEWTQPFPPSLFKKFMSTLTWEDFGLYPDTNLLKTKLAEHHSVSVSNIYLGPGSSECIRNVFECFSEYRLVMTTEPCFPMYHVYAAQSNLSVHRVYTTEDFTYNAADFNEGDLIVLSRPSNPIGYFFTREDIITILENNKSAWVLVDEAYIDYVENKDSIVDLINIYHNLIISRSFSKVFGAAGCRVGYLISHSSNIDLISKLRPMYEISGPSQKYALFLLENQHEIDKYCKKTIQERRKLCELFNSAKLEVISSEGNWIHVQQTEHLVATLLENNIHVKKDIALPNKDGLWLRITVGPGVTGTIEEILH